MTSSFCGVDNPADDVLDLMPSRTHQSADISAQDAAIPADPGRKPQPPPPEDESTDSASDDDMDDDDDPRRADLSLPDEALRHELDLFRTTRAMLIATVTLWLPLTLANKKTTKLTRPAWTLRPETTLTLANIVYAVSESSRAAMTVGEVMAVKWIAATFNETAPSTPRLKPRMWTERDTEMSASTSQSRPTFWR